MNTLESILRVFMQPNGENPLLKLLPYHDHTISLKAAFQDYSGVIQPILFDFDHDSIQNQNDQASVIADYLECSIQI